MNKVNEIVEIKEVNEVDAVSEIKVDLKTKHLFKILTIVNKTGLLKDLKSILLESTSKAITEDELESRQTELGIDLSIAIVSGLDKAEKEIYELLSDIKGVTVKDIEQQDPIETIEYIKAIFNSKVVASFLKKAA